jgi:hypothetical protein
MKTLNNDLHLGYKSRNKIDKIATPKRVFSSRPRNNLNAARLSDQARFYFTTNIAQNSSKIS